MAIHTMVKLIKYFWFREKALRPVLIPSTQGKGPKRGASKGRVKGNT